MVISGWVHGDEHCALVKKTHDLLSLGEGLLDILRGSNLTKKRRKRALCYNVNLAMDCLD
jgi:hypothetical protein